MGEREVTSCKSLYSTRLRMGRLVVSCEEERMRD